MSINKTCKTCNINFVVNDKRRSAKYCSRQCSNNQKLRPFTTVICKKCETKFTTNVISRKFCSRTCGNQRTKARKNDIINKIFGRLTVLEYSSSKQRSKDYNKILRMYKCSCECGNICEKFGSDLRSGTVVSCGCFKKEIQLQIHTGAIPVNRNPNGAQHSTAKKIWTSSYNDGISFDDFFQLSQMNCYYCNSPPSNRANSIKNCSNAWYDQGWWYYNGLDRIDSSKDHSIENVVTSCWQCNKSKGTMSKEDFNQWIKNVYNHLMKN